MMKPPILNTISIKRRSRVGGCDFALYLCLLCVLLNFSVMKAHADIAYLALTDDFWQVWVMQDDGTKQRQITTSPMDKVRASWFPEGQHALVNAADGRVYKVDLESGAEEAISTRNIGYQDAVLSPNGLYFTYSLSRGGSRDANDIWIVDSNGENPRRLTTLTHLQHEPAWSPDSEHIYFLSGDGGMHHNIWRVDISGERTQQITTESLFHFDIAISRNGTLASSNNREGQYDIWLIYPDGSEQRLTQHPGLDARPSWSPDGKELVFESSRSGVMNIWKVKRDSSKLEQLTDNNSGARFPVWFNPESSR